MEEDLILGEKETNDPLEIIDSQLALIASLMEFEDSLYDQFQEDKVKCIVRAMKLIYKTQNNLLKDL